MKRIVLPIAAILMSLNLTAQQDLKIKSISIFKNGQSFVIKKGDVKTNNNTYRLTETPDALFGTLWFYSNNAKINQITSKLDSVSITNEEQVKNFPQLLFANKGKQLTITTTDDKTYNGVVENFDSPESPIAIIKTDGKWISISPSLIKNIGFNYQPQITAQITAIINKPVIDILFDNNGKQNLEMMYLQNGLSWVPTYLLELVSETTANIKLQAELSNNTEDIRNTHVNLVVGVPNFQYATHPATLLSFLGNIEPRYGYNLDAVSSRNMGQMKSNFYLSDKVSEVETEVQIDNTSSSTGDFYFYSIKNLTLPKNGRGSYMLFENTINIKHIYECILNSGQNNNNYDSSYSFEPVVSDVYHIIEVENNTNNPFTTGSIMVIDKKTQRPLTEDMLKYTPINQSSSIKLTSSPDIRVKEEENVLKTQEAAKKANGYSYKLLTIESEVSITNSKKENVAMVIKKTLDGKMLKSSIKYDSSQNPNSDRYNINPVEKLNFKLDVKAGQTSKFTYTYQKYIRE